MKTYRITTYNCMTKKKRRINVEAKRMGEAIEIADYNHVHHPTEDIIKAECWDDE
jgi:hypothetical protein